MEPHFNQEQKEEAKEIEKEIIELVSSRFKYNNLLEIVFAIGAYCLFKKKPEYIKYLWEYKQPPDSDARYAGHDIVPDTINEVVSLYFRNDFFERKFTHWEGHHGSESYYKQYFLLLLARALQNIRPTNEGKYIQIENYNLPNLRSYHLSRLEHSIDGFVEVAKSLKEQKETLGMLGFDTNKLDELFDDKLIPFLKSLKQKAKEQIQILARDIHTNPKKINEFKGQVLAGFSRTVLRNIFKYYELYEDKTTKEYEGTLRRFGINMVDDKAPFFEEWHVSYGSHGAYYGIDLAIGEDSYLLEKIVNNCKEIEEREFEQNLEKFNDLSDVIIFTTNVTHGFFESSKNFQPTWDSDRKKPEIHGFGGWYVFKGEYIPIFDIHRGNLDEQTLILNTSKLGKLVQYSPLNKGEKEDLRKDIFFINIQEFSETPELMENFIKNSPEWLKKIGDENKQREHLQEKVIIHIFERFEYVKHEKFEGYLLKLRD